MTGACLLRCVLARLLRRFDVLSRDERGVAMVEFAFVATIMIFMYVGSTQLSDAINANRRVTITARALADLASRTPSDVGSRIGELTESQLSTIIAASAQVLHPYSPESAQIRVSEVWKCAVPANRALHPELDPESDHFNLAKCLSPFDNNPVRAADPDNIADPTADPQGPRGVNARLPAEQGPHLVGARAQRHHGEAAQRFHLEYGGSRARR